MTPKQVKDIFDKLPSKRRKVLVGFLAGHSREKIMIDADVPSDAALTGHLKELYKNFGIVTGWNDADDRRSGARKLPLLISLFARCMPELISDRIPEVPDHIGQEEPIAKPQRESEQPDASSIEERYFRATSKFDSLEPLERKSRIQVLEEIASNKDFPRYHWKVMEFLADFVRRKAPRKEEEEGEEERSLKIPEDIQAALTAIGQRDLEKDRPKKRLDLSNTDIRGAVLSEGKLQGINFSGANLQGANLSRAKLQKADLTKANLKEADIRGANLQEANVFQAVLRRANLWGANLEKAILMKTDLSWAAFDGSNMRRADLQKANLQGAELMGVTLCESDLSGADLQEVELGSIEIIEDDKQQKIINVNLQGAVFYQANLKGVDLSATKNLESEQIKWAYGNSMTVLPENVVTPAHWM
jgi:uncharacterized protein YjbI with pentapeptide repeats